MPDLFRNFVRTTLKTAVAATDTALPVTSAAGFPASADLVDPNVFLCTLLEGGKSEIVRVTGVTAADTTPARVALHASTGGLDNIANQTATHRMRLAATAVLKGLGYTTVAAATSVDVTASVVVFNATGTLLYEGPRTTKPQVAGDNYVGPFAADVTLEAGVDYHVGLYIAAGAWYVAGAAQTFPHDHAVSGHTVSVLEGYRYNSTGTTAPAFGVNVLAHEAVMHLDLAKVASDSLTVTRAQDGTTAQAFGSGAEVKHAVTAGMLGRLRDGAVPVRATASFTATALAAGAHATGTIAMAKGYRLLAIQTSAVARTRLYTTAAKRDADVSRAVGTDPADNSGLTFEYVTTGTSVVELSPVVDGFQNEATPGPAVPIIVSNTGSVAADITITLTYVKTE